MLSSVTRRKPNCVNCTFVAASCVVSTSLSPSYLLMAILIVLSFRFTLLLLDTFNYLLNSLLLFQHSHILDFLTSCCSFLRCCFLLCHDDLLRSVRNLLLDCSDPQLHRTVHLPGGSTPRGRTLWSRYASSSRCARWYHRILLCSCPLVHLKRWDVIGLQYLVEIEVCSYQSGHGKSTPEQHCGSLIVPIQIAGFILVIIPELLHWDTQLHSHLDATLFLATEDDTFIHN